MMKIIDAHLHFFPDSESFCATAEKAGHEASLSHLERALAENDIIRGIGMGARVDSTDALFVPPMTLPFAPTEWPSCLGQCLGIQTAAITGENRRATLEAFAALLERPETVGLKVYAGYQHFYVYDAAYYPFYELAEHYNVPVVIHTGDTANARGKLRFSHPLTVDEIAVEFPRVNFVMAHYGNPWIVDATEVAKKNPNVYIDLSGLAEGRINIDDFWPRYQGYIVQLQTWMAYLDRYDKLLYGSDWPLVNLADYIALMRRLIPEQHHEAVFYENAARLFTKLRL